METIGLATLTGVMVWGSIRQGGMYNLGVFLGFVYTIFSITF